MFSRNSRYAKAGTYTIRMSSGVSMTAARLPLRSRPAIRAFHQRSDGQRPDGIAAHYLADATAFWRLCDAGDAVAPDALAVRDRIALPTKEG